VCSRLSKPRDIQCIDTAQQRFLPVSAQVLDTVRQINTNDRLDFSIRSLHVLAHLILKPSENWNSATSTTSGEYPTIARVSERCIWTLVAAVPQRDVRGRRLGYAVGGKDVPTKELPRRLFTPPKRAFEVASGRFGGVIVSEDGGVHICRAGTRGIEALRCWCNEETAWLLPARVCVPCNYSAWYVIVFVPLHNSRYSLIFCVNNINYELGSVYILRNVSPLKVIPYRQRFPHATLSMELHQLPVELLLEIATYLSPLDLATICHVQPALKNVFINPLCDKYSRVRPRLEGHQWTDTTLVGYRIFLPNSPSASIGSMH
jgi:hypothetical protein